MPEVIRNRFRDTPGARDSEPHDAPRTRPGFGVDEDPLAELARIVGETAPTSVQSSAPAPAPRRMPVDNREASTGQREYPRRDTSWRDPQARTTVRAGITPQTMPGQLDDLEAELFSEMRTDRRSGLPPAPDLAQLGLPDARMPQYQATSGRGAAPSRPSLDGRSGANGQDRADIDDDVTLPMHSVLRAMPPSARASEELGMQQPPRFNPAPVQSSTQPAGRAASHDAYGHEPVYDDHQDYDPAGAHGGAYHGQDDVHGAAYHDYDEAAYYAEQGHMPPPAPTAHGPAGGYPPVPAQYADQSGHAAHYEDDDYAYAQPQATRRVRQSSGGSAVMIGVVAVVGLLALGAGGVFAYRSVLGGSATGANAPLIHADTKPMKELVAQTPPGATGPNLDVAQSDSKDKLVTQTEDPVDQIPGKAPIRIVGGSVQNPTLAPVQRVHSVIVRPDGSIVTPDSDTATKPAPAVPPVRTASLPTPDAASVVIPNPVQVAPVQTAPGQPAPMVPILSTVPPPSLPPLSATTRIDTVPVAPRVISAPPAVATPKPPVAQVQTPVAQVPLPVVKPAKPALATPPALVQHPAPSDGNSPLALGPSSPTSVQTQPLHVATATPPSTQAPVQRVAPIDGGTGDYMVQISSQRSDAEARKALQVAEQKYGAKGGDVQQADLGARGTYYRARLAGGSHEQAQALCAQIKAQGGDCVVSKR